MKFFVLDQNGQRIAPADYLGSIDPDSVFGRFIRREALGEQLVVPSSNKPAYLAVAQRHGFRWEPHADSGHVQYGHKALLMRRLVEAYARQLVHDIGFPVYEVSGANMFNVAHPVVEPYASLYGERLYRLRPGRDEVVMSYDASYPQFNLAADAALSYRHLPFAHFSIADCYRQEQHGELMLLMRQRRFYMPDLHPYFRDMDEAFSWLPKLHEQIVRAGKAAGRLYQVVVEVPSEAIWLEYGQYLQQLPEMLGADVLVNIIEDGKDRYWVVNIDYKIVDSLGQAREIACIQIDIGNASRLGIRYMDGRGAYHNPVIIHSAIPGGIERYLYSMFDAYAEQGASALDCASSVATTTRWCRRCSRLRAVTIAVQGCAD
jgi:threonyl-tRNA synthetase